MSFLDYFEKNYMQKFEISDDEKKLMELAKEYHDCCDSYDDRICSGVNSYGESMPKSNTEYKMINENSARVRKRIILKGGMMGFSGNEVSKAISKYQ